MNQIPFIDSLDILDVNAIPFHAVDLANSPDKRFSVLLLELKEIAKGLVLKGWLVKMQSSFGKPLTGNQKQMMSNESPSPFYRQPYREPYPGQQQPYGYHHQPRPQLPEETLKTSDLRVERKSFRLVLKESARGRFLRITESNGTKFSTILIPAPGLAEFQQMLNEMVTAADDSLIAVEPEPTPQPVESCAPQAHFEKSTPPEPEPKAVNEAKIKTSKASTKTKTVRKKKKPASKAVD